MFLYSVFILFFSQTNVIFVLHLLFNMATKASEAAAQPARRWLLNLQVPNYIVAYCHADKGVQGSGTADREETAQLAGAGLGAQGHQEESASADPSALPGRDPAFRCPFGSLQDFLPLIMT